MPRTIAAPGVELLRRVVERRAGCQHAAELAALTRRLVKCQVASHSQIQLAIAIQLGEGGRGGPRVRPERQRRRPKALATLAEEQGIFSVARDKEIGEAIAADIAHGNAHKGAIKRRNARCLADILKSAVALVAVEGAVRLPDEEDIQPAVAIEIHKRTATARRLQNGEGRAPLVPLRESNSCLRSSVREANHAQLRRWRGRQGLLWAWATNEKRGHDYAKRGR